MTAVYTVGHSTRTIDEFIDLLRSYGIEEVVDVRTVPRSRRNPQFNSEVLESALEDAGIGYTHAKDLGGLRHPHKDSANLAWRNENFRGFADYMQTQEFADAVSLLADSAQDKTIAIMCAEVLPWRCHRSLIADALVVRGFEVIEIMGPDKSQPHKLTSFARVEGERISYQLPVDS